jgi:hypothetical protein
MRALRLSDDPWATRPAVDPVFGIYSTKPEILTITPADAGVTKIGVRIPAARCAPGGTTDWI